MGRAQKKAERTELLKHKYKNVFNCRFEKLKASNLYVKNLNLSIDDKKLQKLFGHFGQITSSRVMRHESGMSKGFGFVCFSSPEEAMSALHGLNGETKFSLPLFLCPHNLSCDFIRRFLRDILWFLM